jgi:hypothetical protein
MRNGDHRLPKGSNCDSNCDSRKSKMAQHLSQHEHPNGVILAGNEVEGVTGGYFDPSEGTDRKFAGLSQYLSHHLSQQVSQHELTQEWDFNERNKVLDHNRASGRIAWYLSAHGLAHGGPRRAHHAEEESPGRVPLDSEVIYSGLGRTPRHGNRTLSSRRRQRASCASDRGWHLRIWVSGVRRIARGGKHAR